LSESDTIAAIATPVGLGGIGIVRISGEDALRIAAALFRRKGGARLDDLPGNTFAYGRIIDPTGPGTIDEAIALIWRAPKSYTREDVVELSMHGGPIPLRRTLRAAITLGARLAEPGEFTKRAFLNGRIDLAQAEAVSDLIEARTETGGRLAVKQLEGRLSQTIGAMRASLVLLQATIDAGIDFPEDDVEQVTREALVGGLREAKDRVTKLLETAGSGRVYREGVRTALVGRPNVGKSSMLNALLGQDRAIVTDVPGTTRDVIEESVTIQGIPFVLLDTAGIHVPGDVVERIGVDRAQEALRSADLTILILDCRSELNEDDFRVLSISQGKPLIVAVNKVDLGLKLGCFAEVERHTEGSPVVGVSALTGEGLEALREAMCSLVLRGPGIAAAAAVVTNVRHETCLEDADESLQDAIRALEEGVPYDLVSIDIRGALDALGLITGESASEEIIDAIFSRFCVGK